MKTFKENIDFYTVKSYSAAILSSVFFFSAISKIYYWNDTKLAIESLILNKEFSFILTIILLIIELSISISLVNTKLWKYSGLVIISLIIMFTFIVFWGRLNNLLFKCPCFGNLFGAKIGATLLLRNTFLFICAVFLILKSDKKLEKCPVDIYFINSVRKLNFLFFAINFLLIGRLIGFII